jgi:transcriptional regulator with XRE-family HTH domain
VDGKTYKIFRQLAGLRQLDLAKRTGISQPVISLIENDEHIPTPEQRERLQRVLNLPTGDAPLTKKVCRR